VLCHEERRETQMGEEVGKEGGRSIVGRVLRYIVVEHECGGALRTQDSEPQPNKCGKEIVWSHPPQSGRLVLLREPKGLGFHIEKDHKTPQ
jgi:hypothetical protein